MGVLRGTRYSKVLRTWIWISLGLVVVDVLRKVPDFLGPLFPKNIGLGFWMGFNIWLRLGKNVMKRFWEEGVPALSGMNRWVPALSGMNRWDPALSGMNRWVP